MDQNTFSEAVKKIDAIKRNIKWSNVPGSTLSLISEADKIIYSRVHKKVWCLQLNELNGILVFPVLAVALSLTPILYALVIALVAWISLNYSPGQAFIVVFLALYSARFIHEIGHWLFLGRIASPIALYGSPLFVTVRMQFHYSAKQFGLLEFARLYGGGGAANLVVSVLTLLILLSVDTSPPLVVIAVFLSNLATAIINLLPFSKGTDGSMLLRIFSKK